MAYVVRDDEIVVQVESVDDSDIWDALGFHYVGDDAWEVVIPKRIKTQFLLFLDSLEIPAVTTSKLCQKEGQG